MAIEKEKAKTLEAFAKSHKKLFYALNNWTRVKNKNFGVWTALNCIYDEAGGKPTVMVDIITKLTSKDKVRGRSQVYADGRIEGIDILNDTGTPRLVGYSPELETPEKGQKQRNTEIFKVDDPSMQTKIPFRRKVESVVDMGEFVREFYKNPPKCVIEDILFAIETYSKATKMGYTRIMNRIKRGTLVYNFIKNTIEPKKVESLCRRVVVISESTAAQMTMTPYKFETYVKQFIAELYDDAANAQPSQLMQMYGMDRKRLINALIDAGMLVRTAKIRDKDENGNPTKAVMRVQFSQPKNNAEEEGGEVDYRAKRADFSKKLRNLYSQLFESKLYEEGDGGGGEGATTSTSVGGNSGIDYTVPLFGKPIRQKGYNGGRKKKNNDTNNDPFSRPIGQICTGGPS